MQRFQSYFCLFFDWFDGLFNFSIEDIYRERKGENFQPHTDMVLKRVNLFIDENEADGDNIWARNSSALNREDFIWKLSFLQDRQMHWRKEIHGQYAFPPFVDHLSHISNHNRARRRSHSKRVKKPFESDQSQLRWKVMLDGGKPICRWQTHSNEWGMAQMDGWIDVLTLPAHPEWWVW